MFSQISYNVVIDRFKAFADGHYLIRRFSHGQIDKTDLEKDQQFPWMHVVPTSVTPSAGQRAYAFDIVFTDLPREKESNAEYQRESLSDCIRLAEDLLAEIRNGLTLFGSDVELLDNVSMQPFIEEYTHVLTGVTLSCTLVVPWNWSACDIPANYAPGGSGSGGTGGGGSSLVLKVNGVNNVVQNVLDLVEGTGINITDNGDGSVTFTNTGGGGGSVSWGDIVGTLSNQTDLVTALGLKANSADLGAVAFSNDYNDLDNLPTIPDITGLVPYSGATNDVAIGNHNITADDGSFNSAMQPSLFGVENAAATIYSTLEYNGLNLIDSTTGDSMQVNASEIVFPDATTQSTAAVPQVNADWNSVSGVSEILNKPTIPAAQVNSDWNAVSGVSEILNKPTIPAAQIQSDWNQSNNAAVDFIKNKPTLTSGTVTSVGTTGLISGGPITTSGTITTAMSTNKLVGRYSTGSGIMQEISVGSGLTLTGAGVLNNTATPTPSGYYGAWQDSSSQSAAVNNVGYAMIFGVIDYENQVRIVSDGTNLTRITFDNTGIYNLNFSVQIQNTDNAEHDVTIWIRKNGVDVFGSAGYITVPKRRSTGAGLEGHTVAGWNYLLSVIGGDYYQIMWSTTNAANVTLQYYSAGNPPPSTASTLAIVTQQAGIMAGTGITALNALSGAVQTMGVGTSGTDFAISSAGTAHTFNLPTASAANRGALSSADWSTFNAKQAALVSGTSIKTINSNSLLGSGDVAVQATLVSGTNIKTVNSTSLLGSGNVAVAAQDSVSLINNVAVTIGASTTSFVSFCAFTTNSVEASRQVIIPIAGTVKNLYILTASTQSAAGSQVCTVRKNGANTAVTTTIAASAVAGTFSDTTNSVSVAAGDRLSLQVQNNAATGTAAQIVSVAIIIERS